MTTACGIATSGFRIETNIIARSMKRFSSLSKCQMLIVLFYQPFFWFCVRLDGTGDNQPLSKYSPQPRYVLVVRRQEIMLDHKILVLFDPRINPVYVCAITFAILSGQHYRR